jgi:hypothetical protein
MEETYMAVCPIASDHGNRFVPAESYPLMEEDGMEFYLTPSIFIKG